MELCSAALQQSQAAASHGTERTCRILKALPRHQPTASVTICFDYDVSLLGYWILCESVCQACQNLLLPSLKLLQQGLSHHDSGTSDALLAKLAPVVL